MVKGWTTHLDQLAADVQGQPAARTGHPNDLNRRERAVRQRRGAQLGEAQELEAQQHLLPVVISV